MNSDRKQNDDPPIKDDDRPNEPQNHGDDNNYAYRDFSHVKYSDVSHGSKQESSSRKLPARLYAMLKDPALSSIIAWLPHGRSFRVLDRDRFSREILPKHFDHSNFNSFVRLINAWGFRRVPSGVDGDSYYHELFLRGMPHLHCRMKRLLLNEKKAPIESKHRCPNFYSMPYPGASLENGSTDGLGLSQQREHATANQVGGNARQNQLIPGANPMLTNMNFPPQILAPQANNYSNGSNVQSFPQLAHLGPSMPFQVPDTLQMNAAALPAFQQQIYQNMMAQLLMQSANQQQHQQLHRQPQNAFNGSHMQAANAPLQSMNAHIQPISFTAVQSHGNLQNNNDQIMNTLTNLLGTTSAQQQATFAPHQSHIQGFNHQLPRSEQLLQFAASSRRSGEVSETTASESKDGDSAL